MWLLPFFCFDVLYVFNAALFLLELFKEFLLQFSFSLDQIWLRVKQSEAPITKTYSAFRALHHAVAVLKTFISYCPSVDSTARILLIWRFRIMI
jgi:hypothetical protein